ncbi:hypothetical protein V8J82_19525 [Gymnodinialimonas sp. 2305UL16-5]|uniref:hypothetical protein n=1 Tax=Gymnodinialimonas mytili TaxID=3126503 RepID=UPI0030A41C17
MIRAGILALLATPVIADTPLSPVTDWQRIHPGGVVADATLEPPHITITAPGHAPWVIGYWVRPYAIIPHLMTSMS